MAKVTLPNAGKDAEKLDHAYIDGRNVKWYNHSLKVWQFFYS